MKTGSIVKVNESFQAVGIEDTFYLKEFRNSRGKVISVTVTSKGVEVYEVKFSNEKLGYFYEKELVTL